MYVHCQFATRGSISPRFLRCRRRGNFVTGRQIKTSAQRNPRGMNLAGYAIEGISVGGQETCIILPQLKVAFDIGRCPQRAVYQDTVFFSHCHMDHIAGIASQVASRNMCSLKPPSLVVPSTNAAAVDRLMAAFRELDTSSLPYNLVPLDVGEEFGLPNKAYVARPFYTQHVVASQGYLIFSKKKKLKAEYQ
ncbi:tRNA 3' processing endoribonuclease, partial [Cymbomonas tetramitiformis]